MEIHQLTYFVAVVETGGFSRAAERCHVSQPTLSQQIKKLENELGQPLFDRLGRSVALTEAGRNLLPRARSILGELQDIERGLSDEIIAGRGQLSVGFIPTIAPYLLPGVIHNFSEAYPQAELSVYEDLTDNLLDDLVAGKIDVGIMSTPINNKFVDTQLLFTEPLLVATARQQQISPKATIHVNELENHPFIALSEVHCYGEQVHSFCYQKSIDLDIVCHTSQLSTVKSCIVLGLGISLVPQMFASCDTSGQITYHTLDDAMPGRQIVAATHNSRQVSYLANQFIELVKQENAELVRS